LDSKDYSYFQGKIIPAEEAKISVQTHAFQYGTSVFGGIRGYWDPKSDNLHVFRIKDHFHRLIQSTRIMQLKFNKTSDELCEITIELLRKCNYKQNVYLRPIIYTSSLQLSPRFHDVSTDIAIYVLKLEDYLDTKNGLKTIVSSWRRIEDSVIPTRSKVSGGYVNSALAKSEAVQHGFDEAIFLDSRGFVSEGSAENIFIIKNGIISTPSIASSILEGITRNTVMMLAEKNGIKVIERDISRSELYTADEVFFSGTGAQIAWISEIDRRIIGDGKMGRITSTLQEQFFKLVKNEIPEYSHLLTKVY
jgi:branched-chain amino acid aminotransferase